MTNTDPFDATSAQTDDSEHSPMLETRREVIKKIGLFTATLAVTGGVPHFNVARAQSASRYARFRGTTIVVHIPAHPH